jgi:predicted nicotinamide N-methyase
VVAGIPEIRLYQAGEVYQLWERTGRLPYWAFAWPGGQGLARYLLDNPYLVAGRRVLDLAAGSGLLAIAAGRAGAGTVTANDVDPLALAAIAVNAEVNQVPVAIEPADLLSGPDSTGGYRVGPGDVVLAGDVFYEAAMAGLVLPFLTRAAALGALVLVGDPGRAHLPVSGLRRLTSVEMAVSRATESGSDRTVTIWRVD